MQGAGYRMQDTGYRMQDANPVCAFSGGRTRSSVLGVRPSASDRLRCRVPGPRCQIAGTRYLVLAPGGMPVSCFEKPAHGVCKMQDADPVCAFSGSVLGARCPAPGHGGMRGKGDITFSYPSSRPRAENRRPDIECGTRNLRPGTRYRIDAGGRIPSTGNRHPLDRALWFV